MLNVVMLNDIMLNVIMLNVIMLNVIMLNVIMLNEIMVDVILLSALVPLYGLHSGRRQKKIYSNKHSSLLYKNVKSCKKFHEILAKS
jgi:hypothetical protein